MVFARDPLARWLVLGALLVAGAGLIALFIGVVGPLLALAAAMALVAARADPGRHALGLCGAGGVAFSLPFASLPIDIGFKPTFLDVALGALIFVWVFKLVIGQERG